MSTLTESTSPRRANDPEPQVVERSTAGDVVPRALYESNQIVHRAWPASESPNTGEVGGPQHSYPIVSTSKGSALADWMVNAPPRRLPARQNDHGSWPQFTSFDDFVEATTNYRLTFAPVPPDSSEANLSWRILRRAMRFVSWRKDWHAEGAERIRWEVAVRALKIADQMKPIAGEPFLGPATDGSLLLKWRFGEETSVEVYVENDAEFPDCVVTSKGREVVDEDLAGEAHLGMILSTNALAARST